MTASLKRRAKLVAVAGCGLAMALPAAAETAAPTLTSASQSGGRISAEWTLPEGSQADTLELSRRPEVEGEGEFRSPDEIVVLGERQTRWTSSRRFGSGTWYVHVSSSDPDCDDCPVFEWSNVRRVVVPRGAAPKPRPGLYAGPLGDLGDRIRFRLAANRRSIRKVRARFKLKCSRAGIFEQRLRIPRLRVRKGRFARTVTERRGRSYGRISLRGRFRPPRRAAGRLNVVVRDPAVGRCRILFGGRRGLRWTATRR